MYDDDDKIDSARGFVYGLVIGSGLWVVFLAIYAIAKGLFE